MSDNKKKATQWIATFVLIFGGACGIASWLCICERTAAQNLDLSNPEHKKILCGPVGLHNALGRLGITCTKKETKETEETRDSHEWHEDKA